MIDSDTDDDSSRTGTTSVVGHVGPATSQQFPHFSQAKLARTIFMDPCGNGFASNAHTKQKAAHESHWKGCANEWRAFLDFYFVCFFFLVGWGAGIEGHLTRGRDSEAKAVRTEAKSRNHEKCEKHANISMMNRKSSKS